MAVLLCVLQVSAMTAQAREAVEESVELRSRPEYSQNGVVFDRLFTDAAAAISGAPASDPEGLRGPLSSLLVLPEMEIDFVHTDNLYRADRNERDDVLWVARPSVAIRSDWDNHRIEFETRGAIGRHANTTQENYEDHRWRLAGMLQLDEWTQARSSIRGEHTHEERGEIDDPGSAFGPTFLDIYAFELSGEHRVPDGILVAPRFRLTRFRYENNASIDNSDRWRDDYEYRIRIGYESSPGTTLFVEPTYRTLNYRLKFDDNGEQRSSQTFQFLTGVTWDASAVTFVEAGIGFLSAQFDDPAFSDTIEPTARLEATWNATPLLTATSSISRSFSPTAAAGIAGSIFTSFEAGLDWEAEYNLILGIGYGYRHEEFVDAEPAHSRATNRVELTARWLINEYFYTLGEYSYATRSGDLPLDSFGENRVLLTLGAQL